MNLHKHQLYICKNNLANHLKFGQQLVGLTLIMESNPNFKIHIKMLHLYLLLTSIVYYPGYLLGFSSSFI